MTFMQVSIQTANSFYSWGWRGSVVGAAITFAGVAFLMWGTRIRDRYAEQEIAELNASAAKANERAAGLELDAANARLALEQLRGQVEPRRISGDRAVAFRSALERLRASVPEVIVHQIGDGEAHRFAQDIIDNFRSAGIRVMVQTVGIRVPPHFGLHVVDAPGSQVASAFREAGVPVELDPSPNWSGPPWIIVNLRNQPE